jgi:hypothetical protein
MNLLLVFLSNSNKLQPHRFTFSIEKRRFKERVVVVKIQKLLQ